MSRIQAMANPFALKIIIAGGLSEPAVLLCLIVPQKAALEDATAWHHTASSVIKSPRGLDTRVRADHVKIESLSTDRN